MSTALVVEDSSTMRNLMVFALRRIPGMTVVEADDGAAALSKIAQMRFDLIITDINMPVMDGLKLVVQLRGDDQYREVPILIITTEDADEDRKRALELGATDYISKPIRAPQLVDKVKELLRL